MTWENTDVEKSLYSAQKPYSPTCKRKSECRKTLRRNTELEDLGSAQLSLSACPQQSAAILPDSPCLPFSPGSSLIALFGCDSALYLSVTCSLLSRSLGWSEALMCSEHRLQVFPHTLPSHTDLSSSALFGSGNPAGQIFWKLSPYNLVITGGQLCCPALVWGIRHWLLLVWG